MDDNSTNSRKTHYFPNYFPLAPLNANVSRPVSQLPTFHPGADCCYLVSLTNARVLLTGWPGA